MRPTPRLQEPHHFIKRWPRARRNARPAPDVIEWVTYTEMDNDGPKGLANGLRAEISKRTPVGWCAQALTEAAVKYDPLICRRVAYQKVRFFKP